MSEQGNQGLTRREALQLLGALAAVLAAGTPIAAQAKPLRIGIIGTGRIGGALATTGPGWPRVLMSCGIPELAAGEVARTTRA
jgi:hypothetical protein